MYVSKLLRVCVSVCVRMCVSVEVIVISSRVVISAAVQKGKRSQ